jgi:hypothetical protein
MKSLWNDAARRELHARLDRLRPDSAAEWGTMTCAEMVAHLLEGMRLGAGEIPSKPRRTIARRWPMKYVFLYLLAMPKHIPAPVKQMVTAGREIDWDATLATFHRSLDDFVQRDRKGPWPEHPYFGKMSARLWGVIGWKHADHHLRQFGV